MCTKILKDGVLVDLLDGYLQTTFSGGSYQFNSKHRITSEVGEVSCCCQPVALPGDQTKGGFQPVHWHYRIHPLGRRTVAHLLVI